MLLRPKSKGRIMLRDSNYKSKPYIFPNYFADPKDMETIIKGVRLILDIANQPALKALGKSKDKLTITRGHTYIIFRQN